MKGVELRWVVMGDESLLLIWCFCVIFEMGVVNCILFFMGVSGSGFVCVRFWSWDEFFFGFRVVR